MMLRTMDNTARLCIEAERSDVQDAYLVAITADVEGAVASAERLCVVYLDIETLWSSLIDAMVPVNVDAAMILAEIADHEFHSIETAVELAIDKVRKGSAPGGSHLN